MWGTGITSAVLRTTELCGGKTWKDIGPVRVEMEYPELRPMKGPGFSH